MDVLDKTDGYFFHHYFPYAGGYAYLGIGIAYHRAQGIPHGAYNPGYTLFFRVIRKRLHPSRMAGADGFQSLVRTTLVRLLDNNCNALGLERLSE